MACPHDGATLTADFTGVVVAKTHKLEAISAVLEDGGSLWRTVDHLTGEAGMCHVLPDLGDRFEAALAYMEALKNPHVATVIGHGRTPWPHVVYEVGAMQTVRDAVKEKTFGAPDAVYVADQLLDVLEQSHPRGIAHGALSLDTTLVSDREESRPLAAMLGLGLGPVDRTPTMDVRAVGALLYTMVAGEPPVVLPDGSIASLTVIASGLAVPPAFEQVVMLAVGPKEERFANVEEMREALRFADRQLRRPRSGRSARLAVTTAPGMRRAMGNVADFQTSEIPAMPMGFTNRGARAALGTSERSAMPLLSTPPRIKILSPKVQSRLQPPRRSLKPPPRPSIAPVGAPKVATAPAKRPARPITPRPDPVTSAHKRQGSSSRFPWLMALLLALAVGGIVVALVISSADSQTVTMDGGSPGPKAPAPLVTPPGALSQSLLPAQSSSRAPRGR
ncbi:MAG: serine/threonine protein kinase [Myxococcota bacterium]